MRRPKRYICKECGKDMPIHSKRTVYCSDKCSHISRKRNIIEWALEHKGKSLRELKRFYILNRDNFRCIYCGKSSIEDSVKLEVDHIYPKSITKKRIDEENVDLLVTSCSKCNNEKSNMKLSDDNIERIIKRNKEKSLILKHRLPVRPI